MESKSTFVANLDQTEPPAIIAVIGGGAFGTTLAEVAARAGNTVKILVRQEDQLNSINENHRNNLYFPEMELSTKISATKSTQEVLKGCSLMLLCIPAQAIPRWLYENKDVIDPNVLICNAAKGLYLAENCLLCEAIKKALDRDQPYAVLSGPSFAKEILLNQPTAVVIASKYLYHAVRIQRLLSTLYFRCYTTQDVIGVELGGALKNPLAIGAGLVEGSGFGINTMAAFITRSSLELQALCKAMGGEPQTISGLAGIGDLILTAFGDLSRNKSLGLRITRGEKMEDIMKEMTVEGVPTAKVAIEFANKCNLELPIFRAVAAILSGELEIQHAHSYLMGRPLKAELNDNWG